MHPAWAGLVPANRSLVGQIRQFKYHSCRQVVQAYAFLSRFFWSNVLPVLSHVYTYTYTSRCIR